MKQRLSSVFQIVLLFLIGLATSLGLVWITVFPINLSFSRAELFPPDHAVHDPRGDGLVAMDDDERCNAGDWRACLREAEYQPSRRGVLRARAERLLDRECHPRHSFGHELEVLAACGQLALLRIEGSPRAHAAMRECLAEATRRCDARIAIGDTKTVPEEIAPDCNLARHLPRELLLRDEWGNWCDQGDEFACRVEAAGYQVR